MRDNPLFWLFRTFVLLTLVLWFFLALARLAGGLDDPGPGPRSPAQSLSADYAWLVGVMIAAAPRK